MGMSNTIQRNPDQKRSPATYARRRLVAGAVAGLSLLGAGKAVGSVVGYNHDKLYGTDIPSASDIHQNGGRDLSDNIKAGNLAIRKVQPGENLTLIAKEYTTQSHRIENNVDQLIDQNGGTAAVQPGDQLIVPVTTVPNEER